MRLILRLFAGLRERAGTGELELIDLPAPLDLGALKGELSRRYPSWGSLASVRGVLGTRYVADDTPLEDGQTVSLLPPVSGGEERDPLEDGVFEVREDALDPAEAMRRVTHPSCGAVVTFTGVTRATNRSLDVVRLDYEAFNEMAGAEMKRIFRECVERFGAPAHAAAEAREFVLRMLVLHRSGTVGVGEPSVVVAVASPHRDAAFQVGRTLIDELKARVPLWKKEVYADGHHWIGERS